MFPFCCTRLSEAKILTRLYDCEAKSLSASNGTKPCSNVGPKSVPCYATPYELYHTCITAGETSPFEAVRQHLSNRDPLSVHMKIDLGAASLDMLEWIRTSGDVGKLRTLDITLQVGASRSGSKSTGTEQIIKDIETLEGFRETWRIILKSNSLPFFFASPKIFWKDANASKLVFCLSTAQDWMVELVVLWPAMNKNRYYTLYIDTFISIY